MAKVANAATASPSSQLQWFKVFEDGLDGSGTWGVDRMISNNGWTEFSMPACVAPGQYLLRAELIALHSAGTTGGAQFYVVSLSTHLSISLSLSLQTRNMMLRDFTLTLFVCSSGMRSDQRLGLGIQDGEYC